MCKIPALVVTLNGGRWVVSRLTGVTESTTHHMLARENRKGHGGGGGGGGGPGALYIRHVASSNKCDRRRIGKI